MGSPDGRWPGLVGHPAELGNCPHPPSRVTAELQAVVQRQLLLPAAPSEPAQLAHLPAFFPPAFFSRFLPARQVNKATMSMLQRVEPYVAYGYPNLKTVKELIYKRGFGKVGGRACGCAGAAHSTAQPCEWWSCKLAGWIGRRHLLAA